MRKRKKTAKARSNTGKTINIYRDKVTFRFSIDDIVYRNNSGRLKVSQEGYISFLIKQEGKWRPRKGKLIELKVVKEIVGSRKAGVLK